MATGATILILDLLGGTAITAQRGGIDVASRPIEGQLFGLLRTLPLGAVLGVIAMLLVAVFFVSGGGDALAGIQNITIIMATLLMLVAIVMCVAPTRDLRNDPLVRRGERCTVAI